MIQTKEKDKLPEKQLNKMKISNLPYKEFKVVVLNYSLDLRKEWMNSLRTSKKNKKIQNMKNN